MGRGHRLKGVRTSRSIKSCRPLQGQRSYEHFRPAYVVANWLCSSCFSQICFASAIDILVKTSIHNFVVSRVIFASAIASQVPQGEQVSCVWWSRSPSCRLVRSACRSIQDIGIGWIPSIFQDVDRDTSPSDADIARMLSESVKDWT